jgi:hypothetical protein
MSATTSKRHISRIIVNCFFPIVTTFVLNQYCGHWLLIDALHFTIYLSLKLKEKNELLPCFESKMEDEYGLVD